MDHMRKGTLKLDRLKALVLDEADEMLRMGFIEEVEWILEQTPERRQMALFSATMPSAVERIARRHLHDARQISIAARTATAEGVHQRYWVVSGLHKLDALTPAGISGAKGKIYRPERRGVGPTPPGCRPRSAFIRPARRIPLLT
jgi:ATP-dependent RNA helicase DeaD